MTALTAGAAGVLYLAAVLLLLVRRAWQHYRLTGSSGFNGVRGAAQQPAALLAGVGFVLAVLLGLTTPWLVAAGLLPSWEVPVAVATLGALVAAAGACLGATAQRAMGASWRIGVDQAETTDLVTSGPFRQIRNPIFTALMLIQAGTAAMAPTWPGLFAAAMLIAACQVQTRLVEEPYLSRQHDTAYRGYASGTGRFLPGLGRLAAGATPHAPGRRP